jgi:hypothetical protein
MTNPTESEMIAELQRAQSESIQDNRIESENSVENDMSGLDFDPITEDEIRAINTMEVSSSKFNADGYNKILRAKEEGTLIEFASVLPPPQERSKVLGPEVRVNNSDTWARYVYRAANGIPDNHALGEEFQDFRNRLKTQTRLKKNHQVEAVSQFNLAQKKNAEFARIMEHDQIDATAYNQAVDILDWFKSNGMSKENYQVCVDDLKRFS